VAVDFIRGVNIQTSNFSAEYGRQSGASINVVTKSGQTRFYGTVFENLRNDKLDARSFFAPRKGQLRFNVEFVVPHCDPTVNLYDRIYCLRGDAVEAVWRIAARGMSQ
jgi:hypothetical protein